MPSNFAVSRSHIAFGLCLPLAVLLGYMLAEPLQSGSQAIVVMVFAILSVPILMRWYHPILVFCWNAAIVPFFLPGRPAIWMVMALVGLVFAVLNRAVNPGNRFVSAPTVTRSLAALLIVVMVTAAFRGGIGFGALGTSTIGGRGYVYIALAAVGYFALVSRPIPMQRAQLYTALFLLSGLTAALSNLAYIAGPKFYFLYTLFPADYAMDQARAEWALEALGEPLVRVGGVMMGGSAVFGYMLARYGVAGVLDFARPWRFAILVAAAVATLYGGFRSTILLLAATFVVLFCIEGLWRTRFLLIVLFLAVVGAAVTLPFVNKMPLSVQRTLSFLPVDIDLAVKDSADSSTQWRIDLWNAVLPEVPKYFFWGKGYELSSKDLELINEAGARGYMSSKDGAALAGDYHNGPLSVLIPFGVWGVAAFVWFMAASLRILYRNCQFGAPELRGINGYLLALFVSRLIFFVFIFGALRTDLINFAGIIGFSVALNGGVRAPVAEVEPVQVELARAWS